MGIKNKNPYSKTHKEEEDMQAISNSNNNDLSEVYQSRDDRISVFINNHQQRSSYLSDHEDSDEEQKDQREMEERLNSNISCKGSETEGFDSEDDDKCVNLDRTLCWLKDIAGFEMQDLLTLQSL